MYCTIPGSHLSVLQCSSIFVLVPRSPTELTGEITSHADTNGQTSLQTRRFGTFDWSIEMNLILKYHLKKSHQTVNKLIPQKEAFSCRCDILMLKLRHFLDLRTYRSTLKRSSKSNRACLNENKLTYGFFSYDNRKSMRTYGQRAIMQSTLGQAQFQCRTSKLVVSPSQGSRNSTELYTFTP